MSAIEPSSPTPIVAVCPPAELDRRRRLFTALEKVFPLRFEPRGTDFDGVQAVILAAGGSRPAPADRPVYVAAETRAGQPRLDRPRLVATAGSLLLDERLRARSLREHHARVLPGLSIEPDDEVLAALDGRPVWAARIRDGVRRDVVSFELAELEENESLKDALRSGRCLALLPLIHFLREVSGYHSWSRPPLHATFVFDDPNLHWPSYGFLNFERLARHAREHGYHASIATIPLDGWLVESRAARVFREQSSYLSLLIHGNDHSYRELESADDPITLFAQALRRIEALERRANVPISRVVVPPHGRYSEAILRTMPFFSLEALLSEFPPGWWYERPADERLIGRWWPADMSLAGFPILTRYDLAHPRPPDELVFWAYLDHPIILYGHHQDVAEGLDRLAAEAADVGRLAREVVWSTPRQVARSGLATLVDGDVLRVRLFTRRTRVSIPEGTRCLSVELENGYPGADADAIVWGGDRLPLRRSGRRLVATAPAGHAAGGDAEIVVVRMGALGLASVPLPRRRATAVLRRATAETRDRARPLVRRVGADTLLRRVEVAYDRAMTKRQLRRVGR